MKRYTYIRQVMRQRGLRLTAQRDLVLRRALSHLHFTAEELVADVRVVDPSIARASIYRTLGLLQQAGIVEKHDFRYGPPYYEVTLAKGHHDHLMCVKCGEIIEFQEPRIETLQDDVVRRHGYQLMSHTHKLYGLCRTCQQTPDRTPRQAPHLHVETIVA